MSISVMFRGAKPKIAPHGRAGNIKEAPACGAKVKIAPQDRAGMMLKATNQDMEASSCGAKYTIAPRLATELDWFLRGNGRFPRKIDALALVLVNSVGRMNLLPLGKATSVAKPTCADCLRFQGRVGDA